jgi:hypothetical protein
LLASAASSADEKGPNWYYPVAEDDEDGSCGAYERDNDQIVKDGTSPAMYCQDVSGT